MNEIELTEYRQAVASMVDYYQPWDWWATFTFEGEFREYSARKAFLRFIHSFENVKYFYAIESNRFRDGTHVHACVGNVYDVSRRETWRKWFERYGRCHIEPYNPGKNCGEYMTKYMLKKSAFAWDIFIPAQLQLKPCGLKENTFVSDIWREQRIDDFYRNVYRKHGKN